MKQQVSQYRGVFDAHATYRRLRDAGVLGSHSYLHVSGEGAEIGWAPSDHLRLTSAEFGPDWRARLAGIADAAARVERKAFGFVSFDVVDGASETRPDGSPGAPPLVEFIVPGEMVTFGPGGQVTHRSSSGFDIRPHLTVRLPAGSRSDQRAPLAPVATSPAEAFLAGVHDAVEGLRAGQAQKVVLSRFQAFDVDYDPVELFATLFLTPRFVDAFLVSFGDVVAIVASPEVLLDARDRQILSNPLAGTRPRGSTVQEDERLREELRQDPKEIVEHVLSVTTILSQLEPFCEHDSLVVSRLMEMCVQQNVQHLSSIVRGTLSPDRHVLDALWAVFPGVTIAGFPAEPAVRMLRALESGPRGLYSGVLGWVSGESECRFSLSIRGMYRYGSRTYLHAGAGIVPGSRPDAEFAETEHKLAITREALSRIVAANAVPAREPQPGVAAAVP